MRKESVQNGNTMESVVAALESGDIQCFDDVYNVMNQLAANEKRIEDTVKMKIQLCIERDIVKLKSFEKALLLQKVAEL